MNFKEGSLKPAEKTGANVVPVTTINTEEIFENHLPWIRKTKVKVIFGTPIETSSLEKEEKKHLGAKMQEIIQNEVSKNAAL